MTQEKERVRPQRPGDDGPVEEPDSPQGGEGASPGEDLRKEAEKAKEDLEKYRKRSREKFAKVGAEDTQPREKYKQQGGQ